MSGIQNIEADEGKVREFYRAFHTLNTDAKSTPSAHSTWLEEQAQRQNVTPDNIKRGLSFLSRVVKDCTEDEWVAFIMNGEVPPIKLGASEMEDLRGGEICVVSGVVAVAVIGVASVIAGAVIVNSAD